MIVCDSWKTLKDKYLVNQDEYLRIGIRVAVIFGEFGDSFLGEGRVTHQKD